MAHDNFHCLEGRDHIAIGHAMGETFGDIIADYLDDARSDKGWSSTVAAAAGPLCATRRYFPALIEELEAYAAAADVPFRDLWALAIADDFDTTAPERCTTVITNQGRLIAHNEDWDADATEDVAILKTVRPGLTVLELYYYGCPLGGVALSLSSNGYIQAINSVDHADTQSGVPRSILARAMSRVADLETELDRLLAVPRASGFAHTLVDRNGGIVALECSATRHVVSRPSSPFVHTNHDLDPALAEVAGGPPSPSSEARYEMGRAHCDAEMIPGRLTMLMDDRSAGRKKSIYNANTIARGLVDLERQTAGFWLKREDGRGWIDYPIDFIF